MKKKKKFWTKQLIKMVDDEVKKMIKRLYLDDWVIKLNFEEENVEDNWNDYKVAASTTAEWTYHKATISFYPLIIWKSTLKNKKLSLSDKNCVDHEVCHLLTWKLNELASDRFITQKQLNDEIESVTQKLSIILE